MIQMQPDTTGKMTWESIQALNGIQTHDLCVTGPTELSKPHESRINSVLYALFLECNNTSLFQCLIYFYC